MRVILKTRLRAFWEGAEQSDAEGPLRAWYTHASNRTVSWNSWGDVKADYSTASLVGNCVVFSIGGNKYRLITRILYLSQKVFILRVMTHAEYDTNKWKEQCGCFDSPPNPTGRSSERPKNRNLRGR
jgi:mRNA interferase HigB